MNENEAEVDPDSTAKEFAGLCTTLPHLVEIWWQEPDGWYWADLSSTVAAQGPYGTSKAAFEAAAKHFEEEGLL